LLTVVFAAFTALIVTKSIIDIPDIPAARLTSFLAVRVTRL
jgi:hypothetical protein